MVNDATRVLSAQFNKKFGPGTIVTASEVLRPRRFPTGSLSIDLALGGGWVANQWVEIFGPESHGKTAITFKAIAANQRIDPDFTTLWVAAEEYDSDQASALGVDNSRVEVLPTRDMSFAFNAVCAYLQSRSINLVVIDSYPALIAPEEKDADMEDYQVAAGARQMAKFFRKSSHAGHRDPHDPDDAPWLGIMINQNRDQIGGWSPTPNPTTTPGGKAKNYAYYSRLEVKRIEWIEEKIEGKGATKVGQVIRARTIKNKGGPPQRVASVDFYFADAPTLGFQRGDYDEVKDTITMAILCDVIIRRSPKSGHYHFEEASWNGMPNLVLALRRDPGLLDKIRLKVIEAASKPKTWDDADIEAIS